MNITMHKAIMPYGRVIRQEIQLIPDTRNRTFLPWVSPHLISGGIRKTKKVFFTKWEENDNYNDAKIIKKLPINEEFKTITRVYGALSKLENIAEDRFITFDCAKSSKNISTNIWTCLDTLKEIQSSQVCDGKLDCCHADGDCFDKSDEEPERCKGSNNKLVLLSKCAFITVAILGYFVTIFVWSPVIVKIPIIEDITSKISKFINWSSIISKIRWSSVIISDVFDEPKEQDDLDEVTVNLLFQVCKKFEDWSIFNGGECPTECDFTEIRRLYKSLHDENKFYRLRSLHRCIKNFSTADDFKYTCQKITDSLIAFEHEELHKNEDVEIGNQCINNVLCGYWSIADYVIEAREAGGIFPRIRRYLKRRLGLSVYNRIGLVFTITLITVLYLMDTAIPYYDSHMDASLSLTINHIEEFFITTDSKAKTVSYISLSITKYYYFLVSILSSLLLTFYMAINLSVFKNPFKSMLSSNPSFWRTVIGRSFSYMPLIFPYHFMATQFVVYEYRKMKKEDKLKDVLKTFELKESDEKRKENMSCFLKLQGELESILSLKAELKRIIVGSFMINLVVEGIPQLIVMASLLVSELRIENGFGKLRVIFENALEEYIGIPGKASFLLMMIFQIIKIDFSLMTIYSRRTFGFGIGFIGGTLLFFALSLVVFPKFILVSLQFYQAPYIFGLVVILEIITAFLYCKITQLKTNIMEDVLPMAVSPGLCTFGNGIIHEVKTEYVKEKFAFLLRWNGAPYIAILHFGNLCLIYLPLQYILKSSLPQSKQLIITEQINYAIMTYVISIFPFLAMRAVYHQFGRRWRLLESKKENKPLLDQTEMIGEEEKILGFNAPFQTFKDTSNQNMEQTDNVPDQVIRKEEDNEKNDNKNSGMPEEEERL